MEQLMQPAAESTRRITKTDIQQFLLRGRAFIALILVVVVFHHRCAPQFLSAEQYRDYVEARGASTPCWPSA